MSCVLNYPLNLPHLIYRQPALDFVLDKGARVDELRQQSSISPVEIVHVDRLDIILVDEILCERLSDSDVVVLVSKVVFFNVLGVRERKVMLRLELLPSDVWGVLEVKVFDPTEIVAFNDRFWDCCCRFVDSNILSQSKGDDFFRTKECVWRNQKLPCGPVGFYVLKKWILIQGNGWFQFF